MFLTIKMEYSMQKNIEKPQVGVGVIIVNQEGNVLIGKRIGSHAPLFSIPGGRLEPGESFEQAAIHEVKEETNLDIKNPKVIGISNNLETFQREGIHFVSIHLLVTEFSGDLKIMEQEKCEDWQWCDPQKLPEPHFDASKYGIKCFLNNKFYFKNDEYLKNQTTRK